MIKKIRVKNLIWLLPVSLFLVLFHSCQKEISFENGQRSAGSLKKDLNGDCLPITLGGTFTAGQILKDTNFLEVEVNVKRTGRYQIQSDTVNGYSFKVSSNFTTTGSLRVKLVGTGTPLNPGVNIFTVSYDTSSCEVAIAVKNDGFVPAVFTLHGAPGLCMNAAVGGAFVINAPTDTSNKVSIGLNVTTPGTYNITTDTLNGYSFSGSGILSATGLQMVNLVASGTPTNSGTNVFTVSAGASSCTFPVAVLTPITVTNTDYFPLTDGSFWTYSHNIYPGDSVKRTVTDTATRGGNLYKVVDEYFPFEGNKPLFFRKAGSSYYDYAPVDKYTTSFQYGPELYGDILFLKEDLRAGDTWLSAEYSGTATFGQVLILQYQFFCVAANGAANINGNVFANVHKIEMKPRLKTVIGPYGETTEKYDFYFAKGVGLIYVQKFLLGFRQYEQKITRWLVN